MTQYVYISSQQMATFICPMCQRSKTVNVSKYAAMDKLVRVRVKCPCGHAYTTQLEKRKKYRKETNLPGSFVHFVAGRPKNKGLMTVRNISLSGMQLKLNSEASCAIGDEMQVEFHLDDSHRTPIKKRVIVRNVKGLLIGTELAPYESVDKALGFYLFS
jgi:hypothetical protein